ncbi:alpha/beta hydrolase [Longispora albida]|uniref:alpha/beta hydrolase n=1 Tax=Longispora albida TaxID=203523 RepID=UPI00036126C6|nr:alpha/beta fold hydrolase [Longispora albida]
MIRTEDGVELSAVHLAGPDLGACVVLAHGFTGSWRRPAVQRICERLGATFGVVAFDFRGHGQSGGQSTVGDREILDVDAAVGWARSLRYTKIVLLGFSMGASVVIRHAGLIGGVDAVVAVSGPSRWYYKGTRPMRRLHRMLEWPGGRLAGRLLKVRIAPGGWDPVPVPPDEAIAAITPVPVLIVHGDADHYFPVEHAEALYAAANEPKELWLEPGFGHAENAAPSDLVDRIVTWIVATF